MPEDIALLRIWTLSECRTPPLRNESVVEQPVMFSRNRGDGIVESCGTYIWQDELGETFEIQQGEGGEQGDQLMPALFTVEQHPALVEVQNSLKLG